MRFLELTLDYFEYFATLIVYTHVYTMKSAKYRDQTLAIIFQQGERTDKGK